MTPTLQGKLGVVFGVANKRSIAWAIAQAWHKAGAKLAFTYQGERLKDNVEELAGAFGSDTLLLPLFSSMISSSTPTTNWLSMLIAPNSLMITAHL